MHNTERVGQLVRGGGNCTEVMQGHDTVTDLTELKVGGLKNKGMFCF